MAKSKTRAKSMEGNQNSVKLTTEELKRAAYKDYCEYLATGRSKEGWYYKDKESLLCTYKTMEKYIRENPTDFPPINKEMAECSSFGVWEEKGLAMLDGEKNAETALYQMFMRNKFGWDKKEDKSITIEEATQKLDQLREAFNKAREASQS